MRDLLGIRVVIAAAMLMADPGMNFEGYWLYFWHEIRLTILIINRILRIWMSTVLDLNWSNWTFHPPSILNSNLRLSFRVMYWRNISLCICSIRFRILCEFE